MAKKLFESTTTLFPRGDATHAEVMQDVVRNLQVMKPEWATMYWVVNLQEYASGEAKLYIKVMDQNAQPDIGIDMLIGGAIIVVLLIVLYFL